MEILFVIVVSVIIASALLLRADRRTGEWPRISDEEFIAKCSPGVNRDVALRVRRIISEQLDVEYERIHPEQRFVEDLDCD